MAIVDPISTIELLAPLISQGITFQNSPDPPSNIATKNKLRLTFIIGANRSYRFTGLFMDD